MITNQTVAKVTKTMILPVIVFAEKDFDVVILEYSSYIYCAIPAN